MEDKLFMGLGRTWFVALVLMVLSTLAFIFSDKLSAELWFQIIALAYGGGTVKSTFVGTGAAIANGKKKGATP
ncbi:MAG TPA: hypothetical protein VFI02_14195 [Armatimonadota bacterium]|nr:hypothetical protein [Armatimonadota bacterium]